MSVRVTGSPQLHTLRQALRETGNKGLGKELGRGLRRAGAKFAPTVQAEAVKAMPSGYGPTLSRSMRFRTTVREGHSTAWVLYRVYGDGRREKRDVPALNRGVLRHPTYGRRGHWVSQKVRAGFVDRPVDRLSGDVAREMRAVVDYIADQITRG
ncbi:hypothetical protein [Micromonospora sp. NPDC005113]